MTEQQAMLDAQWTDGGGDWANFFQDLTKTIVGGYANYTQMDQQNSFQIAQDKIRYLGQDGYYTAGQPMQRTGGISSTMLLIGGALLVYMLVKN